MDLYAHLQKGKADKQIQNQLGIGEGGRIFEHNRQNR